MKPVPEVLVMLRMGRKKLYKKFSLKWLMDDRNVDVIGMIIGRSIRFNEEWFPYGIRDYNRVHDGVPDISPPNPSVYTVVPEQSGRTPVDEWGVRRAHAGASQ
jgi:hypothetical protein